MTAMPWSARVAGFVAGSQAAGALLLLGAWLWSRGAADLDDQVACIELGMAGLGVASAGAVGWLLMGRRATLARRALALPTRERAAIVPAGSPGTSELVMVARGTRAHRIGCPLVAGKRLVPVSASSAARACEVCR